MPAEAAAPAPAEARARAALAEDRGALLRLLVSLAADELGRRRGRPLDRGVWGAWGDETTLDEDGAGLDSLARLELATRLEQAFELRRTGVEDYLLVRRSFGDWAEILAEGLRRLPAAPPLSLGFRSSGSTGEPKPCRHPLPALAEEAELQAAFLPRHDRVAALVPVHHIYGFLFGVLGPRLRGIEAVDLRGLSPGEAASRLRPGDLAVATPFLWGLFAEAGARLPDGVAGVTSTAPAPPELWPRLAELGLGALVEIYGATETAGLGWRTAPEAPFALFETLEPGPGGEVRRRSDGAALPVQDRLDWEAPRRFRVRGRADGAVQVGGVNVAPERVRAVLSGLDGVADCAVRLDGGGAGARLKAYLVPAPGGPSLAALEAAARARAEAALAAPERPARYSFGPEVPRDALGKPADWA